MLSDHSAIDLVLLFDFFDMALQTLAIAAAAVVYFIIRYFNRTDVPKIKGLPEIPGVPIFGNLLQLGDKHATVAGAWAKKYGPVFQVRMGNKVRSTSSWTEEKYLMNWPGLMHHCGF